MNTKTHRETVYTTKAAHEVSWFQEHSTDSLPLIRSCPIDKSDPIIDVGGGASGLVDSLLAEGFQSLTVLDLSASALQVAKDRLGKAAAAVHWVEADVTEALLPFQHFALWYGRAVFHFLTHKPQWQKYVEQIRNSVVPGGHVIIATFAPDGPSECRGLNVI